MISLALVKSNYTSLPPPPPKQKKKEKKTMLYRDSMNFYLHTGNIE